MADKVDGPVSSAVKKDGPVTPEKREAPPKVGPEAFADEQRAGNERNLPEPVTPPKVGDEIFTKPKPAPDPGAPIAVEDPVGSEVFSDEQMEGIVRKPILPTGGEATPAARKHAEELGVDLNTVTPSGDKITKADVAEAYVPPATDAAAAHAQELGVDLKDVTPTGKDNTITKADVQAHVAGS